VVISKGCKKRVATTKGRVKKEARGPTNSSRNLKILKKKASRAKPEKKTKKELL